MELIGVEPATTVVLTGGEHGHFNQHSHNLPCHHSSTLSDQHVADRRPGEADRPHNRHHHRRSIAAEIPGGLLAPKAWFPAAATRCR